MAKVQKMQSLHYLNLFIFGKTYVSITIDETSKFKQENYQTIYYKLAAQAQMVLDTMVQTEETTTERRFFIPSLQLPDSHLTKLLNADSKRPIKKDICYIFYRLIRQIITILKENEENDSSQRCMKLYALHVRISKLIPHTCLNSGNEELPVLSAKKADEFFNPYRS